MDNHSAVGYRREDAIEANSLFGGVCEAFGLGRHEEIVGVKRMELLGVVLDLEAKSLYNRPKRIWRFLKATQWLLRLRRAPSRVIEVWLGHAIHLSRVARPLLSVFCRIYEFLQLPEARSHRICGTVRREMWLFAALIPLAEAPLAQEFNEHVYIGGSSDLGHALMRTRTSEDEQQKAFRFRERWRFVMAAKSSCAHALGRRDGLRGRPFPPWWCRRRNHCCRGRLARRALREARRDEKFRARPLWTEDFGVRPSHSAANHVAIGYTYAPCAYSMSGLEEGGRAQL